MNLFTRCIAPLSLGVLGLTYSSTASAEDAVVVPLYSPNLNAQKIGNITSLITSEVDFAGRYDMVSQSEARPASLTPKCLKSVSCLKGIAANESSSALIAGSVSKKGGSLEFFLVQYENGKIIRMKRFTIDDTPLAVAADVGGPVQALVTGKEVVEEEDNSGTVNENDFLDEEGDIFGAPTAGELVDTPDNSAAEEEARRQAEEQRLEEARRQAEEQRLEEARLQAEEQRRLEEQRRMEEEAAKLAAAADQGNDDFDFSFAPSTVEVVSDNSSTITEEEEEVSLNLNQMTYEQPKKTEVVSPRKEITPKKSTAKKKKNKSARSSHIDANTSITGKIGGSTFQGLNFLTYGAELGVHLTDWVAITIGGEGYTTPQLVAVIDESTGQQQRNDNGDYLYLQQWRLIIPVSAGTLVHFPGKIAKPYIGAELQLVPGYMEAESGVAFGFRGRAGSNFMFTDGFGLNLNVGAGFWSGEGFTTITTVDTEDISLQKMGFIPQVSVGTIFAF